jgi:NAD+ kinase
VWIHASRAPALQAACRFIEALNGDFEVLVVPDALGQIKAAVPKAALAVITPEGLTNAEVMVVFGGDGTILRAAEWALAADTPVLGVNLGHVGFLAELEMSQVPELVSRVVAGEYVRESRMTIEMDLFAPGATSPHWSSLAINEVALEKASRAKMIECLVSIDGEPVSNWGCDGILVSTPTGSTAYAFSAGGPVMWPQLKAFEVVPLLAHALFARPMVLGSDTTVSLQIQGEMSAVVTCDGYRWADVPTGSRIEIRRHPHDLRVARLSEQPFTSRLVRKFALPIDGWRGRST